MKKNGGMDRRTRRTDNRTKFTTLKEMRKHTTKLVSLPSLRSGGNDDDDDDDDDNNNDSNNNNAT